MPNNSYCKLNFKNQGDINYLFSMETINSVKNSSSENIIGLSRAAVGIKPVNRKHSLNYYKRARLLRCTFTKFSEESCTGKKDCSKAGDKSNVVQNDS